MLDSPDDKGIEFLFKEYDTAKEVTFHVDKFRHNLSTFFLSFAGAASAVILFVLQQPTRKYGDADFIAGAFLVGVGFLGTIILLIHARLRKVQLEHFQIISRMHEYCFRSDKDLWNVVRLSRSTLPAIHFWESNSPKQCGF